ncbi:MULTISPECIES: NYN domain-containing protein [Paenibacillus]|uniref:NYN domain-containing protein n=1 Tax=Paenibacillus TaxID=44249 RepID=UPI00073F7385|nr:MULTISPECIES: NYN domain-containing protein [Paenibacillus]MDU4695994.1 NYN domain-containing protein [Paenibacillus sp.]
MRDLRDVLLVDGYNMIGGWPELAELSRDDLQAARDRLLERLADYQAFSGRKVIVVFDAYRVPGLGKAYSQNKVEMVFTKEKETADECIERLVGELSHRRRQIYVATSDMVEQHVIFGQGALRVSARELLIQVEQSEKEIQAKIAERSAKSSRNTLDTKLSPEQRQLFERWRRE